MRRVRTTYGRNVLLEKSNKFHCDQYQNKGYIGGKAKYAFAESSSKDKVVKQRRFVKFHGDCFSCGKYGHLARECKARERINERRNCTFGKFSKWYGDPHQSKGGRRRTHGYERQLQQPNSFRCCLKNKFQVLDDHEAKACHEGEQWRSKIKGSGAHFMKKNPAHAKKNIPAQVQVKRHHQERRKHVQSKLVWRRVEPCKQIWRKVERSPQAKVMKGKSISPRERNFQVKQIWREVERCSQATLVEDDVLNECKKKAEKGKAKLKYDNLDRQVNVDFLTMHRLHLGVQSSSSN